MSQHIFRSALLKMIDEMVIELPENFKLGELFESEYIIPSTVIQNKSMVAVRFEPHNDTAERIFGCATLISSFTGIFQRIAGKANQLQSC